MAAFLDLEASEPVHTVPPPFSEALDWSMDQHVAELTSKACSDAQAEIRQMLDVTPDATPANVTD